MQIDWFTFFAQVINFGILLWLLNRFLFTPMTKAIAERESAIQGRILAADSKFARGEEVEQEWKTRQRTIDAEAESLRTATRDAVEQERRELLEAARESVEQQRSKWNEQQAREVEAESQAIKTDIAHAAIDVARRALRDLASDDLDAAVVRKLLAELPEMCASTRASLRSSAASDTAVVVSTTCELTPAIQDEITAALGTSLGGDILVRYEQSADLVAGIRIAVGSHELEWSVCGFLESLSERFAHAVASE